MIDLKALKSAEAFTDEGRISELLLASHEQWRAANPQSAKHGMGGTVIREAGTGVVVEKRANTALADVKVTLTADELKTKAVERGFEWRDGDQDRVLPYWASDDRRDRHGDRVDQAWKFDDYAKNPIMLLSHGWHGLTIGGIIDWQVAKRKDGKWEGDALRLLGKFATKEDYEVADTVFRLAKAKYMRAGSVGFFPQKIIRVKDKAEREELDLGENGLIFSDNALIEWSPCAVPAHPSAGVELNRLKSMGVLRPTDVAALRLVAPDDDAAILEAWRVLFPEAKVGQLPTDVSTLVQVQGGGVERGWAEIVENLLTALRTDLQQVNSKLDDLLEHAGVEEEDTTDDEEETPAEGDAAAADDKEDLPAAAAASEDVDPAAVVRLAEAELSAT